MADFGDESVCLGYLSEEKGLSLCPGLAAQYVYAAEDKARGTALPAARGDIRNRRYRHSSFNVWAVPIWQCCLDCTTFGVPI